MIVVEDDGCLGDDEIKRYDQLVLKARREDKALKIVLWLFGLAGGLLVLRVVFGGPYGGV